MNMPPPNPKAWTRKEDLPLELRGAIAASGIKGLLQPGEGAAFKATLLEAFAEVAELYMEKARHRWAMEHLHATYPDLPLKVVFAAVALELGVSPERLKAVWYETRKTRGILHLVQRKATEKEAALDQSAC